MTHIRRSADGLTVPQLLQVASALDLEATRWASNMRMVEGFYARADAIRGEALELARSGSSAGP